MQARAAMTIAEAFEAFEVDELLSEGRSESTIHSYRNTRNSLLRSIGDDVPTALLTYIHVITWKKDMHEWENLPSYMAGNLRNLRRILTYLKDHGFATLDPAEIKLPQFKYRKTAWLTMEEMASFLGAIDECVAQPSRSRQSFIRDKALFAMQFSSGARISEMLQLNRDAVETILNNKKITVRGKGQQEDDDELLFDANALQALKDYVATRDDILEPLFLSREYKRLAISTAIQGFHRYLKKAGIKRNGAGATHILRHSFGTDLDVNGMDLHDISKQMRHSRIETSRIYVHSGDKNRRQDYDKHHTPTPV
jgi:site-specific recombinase XerD